MVLRWTPSLMGTINSCPVAAPSMNEVDKQTINMIAPNISLVSIVVEDAVKITREPRGDELTHKS